MGLLEELEIEIDTIPGEDGWWKHHSQDTYQTIAKELVSKGVSPSYVVNALYSLYWAAAECYGG